MSSHPPRISAALLLACLVSLAPSAARAETVFIDPFDDGDVRAADAQPYFWSVLQPGENRDSEASEEKGRLRLRAATGANTYVAIVSPALDTFGFFQRPVTVTLEDIALEAKGIPESDARFKLSLASTQERAEQAGDVISLRIRPGLLMFGYRIDGFDTPSPPETLSGSSVNSVVHQPLAGTPSRISLTLGPSPRAGHIRYEIRAEGNGVSFTRAGQLALTLSQWGGADAASLVIDARRDSTASLSGTHTDFSIGQITVTR